MNKVCTVVVNGKRYTFEKDISVQQLLDKLGIDSRKVAVEVNREIVRRGEWDKFLIKDGYQVEIVRFVQGG